jgi:hypothetical protein
VEGGGWRVEDGGWERGSTPRNCNSFAALIILFTNAAADSTRFVDARTCAECYKITTGEDAGSRHDWEQLQGKERTEQRRYRKPVSIRGGRSRFLLIWTFWRQIHHAQDRGR